MLHARSDYNRIQDPWADSGDKAARAIAKDEPVLLLRGQDKAAWIACAVYAIVHYVMSGGERRLTLLALYHSVRMFVWARKDADVPDEVAIPDIAKGAARDVPIKESHEAARARDREKE